MKIKMIGFKVGKSRPVANKTIDLTHTITNELGCKLAEMIAKSDFISIRRVK